MEKYYNEDGKVGTIVSPGFGAGWSTWCDSEYATFLLHDKKLVEMCLKKSSVEEVDKYISDKFGEDAYIYTGGWRDCSVEFLNEGQSFRIDEYDGSESLVIDNDWRIA
jgi:hypothetical protein